MTEKATFDLLRVKMADNIEHLLNEDPSAITNSMRLHDLAGQAGWLGYADLSRLAIGLHETGPAATEQQHLEFRTAAGAVMRAARRSFANPPGAAAP